MRKKVQSSTECGGGDRSYSGGSIPSSDGSGGRFSALGKQTSDILNLDHLWRGLTKVRPRFLPDFSIEAFVKQPHGSQRALFPVRFLFAALLFCCFFTAQYDWSEGDLAASVPPLQESPPKQAIPSPRKELPRDPIEEHYRAAESFQIANDLNSAEQEYHRVISLGMQRMAAIRILSRDEKQAIAFLNEAKGADPSDLDAQMSLASVYFQTGDLVGAKSVLLALLARDNHRLPARNLLGQVYFTEADYVAAAEQFKSIIAEGPDIDASYGLALAYLRLNKLAEASQVFDEMRNSLGSAAKFHILLGRAYLDSSRFDLAAGELRKALSLNSAAPRAHAYLGLAYLLQKDAAGFSDAAKEFETELANNPEDFFSHYYLGLIRFKQKKYTGAEGELTKAARQQPENPDVYFYLGQSQFEGGQSAASAANFEKAIRLYGGTSTASQPAHASYSKVLEKLGRYAAARAEEEIAKNLGHSETTGATMGMPRNSIDEFRPSVTLSLKWPEEASRKIPKSYLAGLKQTLGNAYHNLGVIDAQRAQYSEAAHLFEQAAKWSPKIPALDRNWGTASFRANDYKSAIVPLQRHSKLNPEDVTAKQMLAVCFFLTDDFANAAETFRPLLASLPDDPSLLYAAGISMAKSGDPKTAGDLFNRMLVQNPDSAEVHLFLGQAHAAKNEDADALTEFSRALQLNPRLPEAHYSAGKIYLGQKNLEEAEKEFRAELEINPDDAPSEFRLGHVLLAQHKQADAIDVLKAVVKQRPEDADALFELSKAQLENGDAMAAIEQLEKAIRLKPEQSHMYYQLSIAYHRQGRTKEAQEALQHYQKLQQEGVPGGSKPGIENPL
jgi:tetratricopeptide (TPR) repeat protein